MVMHLNSDSLTKIVGDQDAVYCYLDSKQGPGHHPDSVGSTCLQHYNYHCAKYTTLNAFLGHTCPQKHKSASYLLTGACKETLSVMAYFVQQWNNWWCIQRSIVPQQLQPPAGIKDISPSNWTGCSWQNYLTWDQNHKFQRDVNLSTNNQSNHTGNIEDCCLLESFRGNQELEMLVCTAPETMESTTILYPWQCLVQQLLHRFSTLNLQRSNQKGILLPNRSDLQVLERLRSKNYGVILTSHECKHITCLVDACSNPFITALVALLILLLSGDIEENPGPLSKSNVKLDKFQT